ncbi:MAG: hypothetical protein KME30_32565 [Iphinoe sp. HA4291-MV1]|jgi:hypothetical protein|nr:hypothetical protein [Iphinoe sp. HA4291-MV1]
MEELIDLELTRQEAQSLDGALRFLFGNPLFKPSESVVQVQKKLRARLAIKPVVEFELK